MDFDRMIERRAATASWKWHAYDEDVLPLWVADMDFLSPAPVVQALRERVDHGVYGYDGTPPLLTERIRERLLRLYGWEVAAEELVFVPGIVCGFNIACRAFGSVGGELLAQTPVYPPFLAAPGNHGMTLRTAELVVKRADGMLRYEVDQAVFEAAVSSRTELLLISHPHNPVGMVFDPETLRRMVAPVVAAGGVICSDEIHCDLLLDERARHVPTAMLSPEIADRCVTFMAPSKTFNVPGLGCGFAVIRNPVLRQAFCRAMAGIVPHVNALGWVGALAAYAPESEPWLAELLVYLRGNRDFLAAFVRAELPDFAVTRPAATYLAWMDCRLPDGKPHPRFGGRSPYAFFRDEAKVAFSDGATFGEAGTGFVRINFGCPRARLEAALGRIRRAVRG